MCLRCALHCAKLSVMPTHTDLIGSTEACRILNIDKATLTRWAKARDPITAVHQLPGRNGALLFNRADIERLAAERTEQSA